MKFRKESEVGDVIAVERHLGEQRNDTRHLEMGENRPCLNDNSVGSVANGAALATLRTDVIRTITESVHGIEIFWQTY